MDEQLQQFIVNLVSENMIKAFKEKDITSGIQVFEDETLLKWLQVGFYAYALKNGEEFAVADGPYPMINTSIVAALQKNNCELYKALATKIQLLVNDAL